MAVVAAHFIVDGEFIVRQIVKMKNFVFYSDESGDSLSVVYFLLRH